jgi:hypothetical protein
MNRTAEYAKADQEDILVKITTVNCGPEPAECHILPTPWFRNTWSNLLAVSTVPGAVNPSLTAMGNALPVGGHLLETLG